ncbi:hypothetical protein [Streptomyces sp. AHA2]|uniref:hypothetical protein n=1 Tax=Streptomyces sp. AHA2 TaxID=3064526 RepID=UPI002FE1F3EA
MIQPEKIPQFTGDLEQLESDYAALKKDAGAVRGAGGDIHSRFQGLSAYYTAPEAERLFATTKPVKDRADAFADDLETVSGALSSYAAEVRPLVAKLKQLKADAAAFVSSVKDDDEWEYDEDKVGEHNKLRDDITATVAAFWAAERTCHNKITALFPGGAQMVAGDGSDKANQYGFNAEDLKNAKLPWGDPVEEKHHWYEVGHWVKSFVWDGLIVDGVWGTIKGLGTLVGFGGWEAMGQAWKGLAQLATGLALSAIPGVATAFWTLPDDKLPSWIRDSRTAMKETGKALVAWDQWGKNPARAAGAVTFNVLTTVFTGGAGAAASGAGKAGAVAKALSVAGKAGRVIDPMTYIAKGAGAGLSKIGDITKGLRGVGAIDIPALPENALTLPKGSSVLPDGTVHLPEGAAVPAGLHELPGGGFKVPDDVPVVHEDALPVKAEGGDPTLYADGNGNIVDGQGKVLLDVEKPGTQDVVDRPAGPDSTGPAGADVPRVDSPAKVPAMAGAAPHTVDAGTHLNLGNSLDNGLGDVGRATDNPATTPAVHAGGDVPTVHAGGDVPTANAMGDHLPAGRSTDDVPAGHADDPGRGRSASHEPGGGHSGGTDGAGSHATGGHGGAATGGHEGTPTGSGGESPGQGSTGSGGSDGPTGHGPGEQPGWGGADDAPGWERPSDDSGPLDRGGDAEQRVREQIRGTKVKPGDVDAILDTLGNSPAGKEIADTIASGRFRDAQGFSDVVSNLSRPSELPGSLEQIRLANRLHENGLTDISFEVKQGGHEIKPGVFTGPKTDLDLMARDASGNVHGWQFKDMTGADSPVEASKVVRNIFKKLGQLTDSSADVRTFVVDTKISALDMETEIGRLQKGYEGKNVQFVIRCPDGMFMIPRGGTFTPEGAL